MKKCQACNQTVDQGNFCPKCGGQVIEVLEVVNPTPEQVNQAVNGAAGKSKLTAGLLGIFLGAWGVHRFYLGYTGIGVAQILVTLVTCGAGSLWGLIEGILILCGKGLQTDAQGNPLTE
jgi:TM2 domain-containing membrane protein YozV